MRCLMHASALLLTLAVLAGCKTTDVRREAYYGEVEATSAEQYCVASGDRLILTLSQQRRLRVMHFKVGGHILTIEFQREPVVGQRYVVPSDAIKVVVWPGITTDAPGLVLRDVRGSVMLRAIDTHAIKAELSLSAPGSDWSADGQVRFKRGASETRRPCRAAP